MVGAGTVVGHTRDAAYIHSTSYTVQSIRFRSASYGDENEWNNRLTLLGSRLQKAFSFLNRYFPSLIILFDMFLNFNDGYHRGSTEYRIIPLVSDTQPLSLKGEGVYD